MDIRVFSSISHHIYARFPKSTLKCSHCEDDGGSGKLQSNQCVTPHVTVPMVLKAQRSFSTSVLDPSVRHGHGAESVKRAQLEQHLYLASSSRREHNQAPPPTQVSKALIKQGSWCPASFSSSATSPTMKTTTPESSPALCPLLQPASVKHQRPDLLTTQPVCDSPSGWSTAHFWTTSSLQSWCLN